VPGPRRSVRRCRHDQPGGGSPGGGSTARPIQLSGAEVGRPAGPSPRTHPRRGSRLRRCNSGGHGDRARPGLRHRPGPGPGNTPHNHLSAADFADFAARIGPERGLQVEVFGMEEIEGMGLAGLLCVNAGGVQGARMIKLSDRPADPARSLAMVGKGIMYDSGGISLKPSDAIHAQMKNDMSGAAAILAAMCSLETLGCRTAVTGYLMCTDNVPSGTATALGDVITYQNGTTVEILDSDAEGRAVMADGLILAAEEGHDAVVDIATLTGSALRALGSDMAALFGNDADLIERAKSAAAHSGAEVWQMPLHRPYKKELDSLTADM